MRPRPLLICCEGKTEGLYFEAVRHGLRITAQNVKLALSVPQFETYLVQHFALRNTKKKGADLERELSELIGSPYRKGNLDWLEQKIDEDPNILEFAIRNSKQFSHSTKIPFLTVQELTAELLTMAR